MKNILVLTFTLIGLTACQTMDSRNTATGELEGKKIVGHIEKDVIPGIKIPIGFTDETHQKAYFYDTDTGLVVVGCRKSTSGTTITFGPC